MSLSTSSDSRPPTTKQLPSGRARDYYLDVGTGSKTEMKCSKCSKMVKAPAGALTITC